jgi:antitoxin FitA
LPGLTRQSIKAGFGLGKHSRQFIHRHFAGVTVERFMATVTIRNLDEKVVEALKAQAKANGRSLQAELRHLLSEVAARRDKRQAFIKEAERIRRMTSKGHRQSDSTDFLREDRSR